MSILLRLVSIVLGSVIMVAAISAHASSHQEICKQTILYPLTFPPGKAEHVILCHPVGKALAAANNANIQFNAGVVAGQKVSEGEKCPSSNKDFCEGWNSTRIINMSHHNSYKAGYQYGINDWNQHTFATKVHFRIQSRILTFAKDMTPFCYTITAINNEPKYIFYTHSRRLPSYASR